MIQSISILIPCFNCECFNLVEQLHYQAKALKGVKFEIIVAEDGSTDKNKILANSLVSKLDHCKHIILTKNIGRAKIRNFLAKEAQCEWLLFIDSGITINRSTFLFSYLKYQETSCVVYGGVAIPKQPLKKNLRYKYEKKHELKHSVAKRSLHPYQAFRSCNFMIHHEVMEKVSFNNNLKSYGYEDVLFGKSLAKQQIRIRHIDNPILYTSFEPNNIFLSKTEDSLRNLKEFSKEMYKYSTLIKYSVFLKQMKLVPVYRCIFKVVQKRLKKQLCGSSPSLITFDLYKLGYYLDL